MKIEAWGQTDVGLKRELNQDSILIDSEIGLYIVADGMGGHRGGEVASALAVETMRDIISSAVYNKESIHPKDLLTHAYREASRRIYHKSTKENPELMGMGTTMVAGLLFEGTTLYVGNVGDSRAYLLRGQHLWQLTEDHSLVYEQVKAGTLSQEDAERMLGKNVITRSVGFEKVVDVDIIARDVAEGDTFVLCSDGLTGMVTDPNIAQILQKGPLETSVSRCIDAAKEGGGDDNISVLVMKVRQ